MWWGEGERRGRGRGENLLFPAPVGRHHGEIQYFHMFPEIPKFESHQASNEMRLQQ